MLHRLLPPPNNVNVGDPGVHIFSILSKSPQRYPPGRARYLFELYCCVLGAQLGLDLDSTGVHACGVGGLRARTRVVWCGVSGWCVASFCVVSVFCSCCIRAVCVLCAPCMSAVREPHVSAHVCVCVCGFGVWGHWPVCNCHVFEKTDQSRDVKK